MKTITTLLFVLLLASCASTQDDYCVEQKKVPIIVNNQVHFVDSGCKAWSFGPSQSQQRAFESRSLPSLKP